MLTPCYHIHAYADECDHLRDLATKRLERSGVVDTGSGGAVVSDIRTSDGMFFGRGEDDVIESEPQGSRSAPHLHLSHQHSSAYPVWVIRRPFFSGPPCSTDVRLYTLVPG